MVRKLSDERLKEDGQKLIDDLGNTIEILTDLKEIAYEYVGGEDLDLAELRRLLTGFDGKIANIEGAFANIFRNTMNK
jgi:hypothetical protein